jgi:hypothetical protein
MRFNSGWLALHPAKRSQVGRMTTSSLNKSVRALVAQAGSAFANGVRTASARTRHWHIMNTESNQSEKTVGRFRSTPRFRRTEIHQVRKEQALRQGWICVIGEERCE